jgi:translocator protein
MFKAPFYHESPLQPPGYVFSGVWLLIYPLIGVSGAFLFAEQPNIAILWLIQLVVNLTWVPGLFVIKNLWFSFLHLLILLVLVIVIFYYASTKIKAIWLPYMLWLIFACVIFFDTLRINTTTKNV